MSFIEPSASNNNCVAYISEQIELANEEVNRLAINTPIKNTSKEKVLTQQLENKRSSLITTVITLSLLLGLSLIITGISLSVLVPVIINIAIPLVVLGLGVLFFSIITALGNYVKKNQDQINQSKKTGITQIEKEKIKKEAITVINSLRPEENINKTEEELQKRIWATNKIQSLYRQRNKRLLAKKENGFSIIKAQSSFYVDHAEKGLVKQKKGEVLIDYSEYKRYRKDDALQTQRLYLKLSVPDSATNKTKTKLRFVGNLPDINLNKKYIKKYEKVWLGTADEKGAFKTLLLHDDNFAILNSTDDTVNNTYVNDLLINNESFTPLTKFGYSKINPNSIKIITPYRGKTLDKLLADEIFQLHEFEPFLADIKKIYEKGVYVSDIKMSNITVKKVNGVNKFYLIDTDSFIRKDIEKNAIIYNYVYNPSCLIRQYQKQKSDDRNNLLIEGRLPYWETLLNLETYALLQMLFDLHRKKEKTVDEIVKNKVDDPEVVHTDAYIKAFNKWVDLAILPDKREAVKKFISCPIEHPVDAHAYDLIDFMVMIFKSVFNI